MSSFKSSVVALTLALASAVQAHFSLAGCDVGDQTYERPAVGGAWDPPADGIDRYGFDAGTRENADHPDVGWHSSSYDASHLWLGPSSYVCAEGAPFLPAMVSAALTERQKTPDFVCGVGYESGSLHAQVAAGSEVKVRWGNTAPNHRGPVIDYLAPCHGKCKDADKTKLEFIKIAQMGLVHPGETPTEHAGNLGVWASDLLFRTSTNVQPEGGSGPDLLDGFGTYWMVKIPLRFPSGYYVLRTELLASFAGVGNIQHYNRCLNLEVTGGGSELPGGVTAADLYDPMAPGIQFSVSDHLQNYSFPGPAPYQSPDYTPSHQPKDERSVDVALVSDYPASNSGNKNSQNTDNNNPSPSPSQITDNSNPSPSPSQITDNNNPSPSPSPTPSADAVSSSSAPDSTNVAIYNQIASPAESTPTPKSDGTSCVNVPVMTVSTVVTVTVTSTPTPTSRQGKHRTHSKASATLRARRRAHRSEARHSSHPAPSPSAPPSSGSGY
ncbi:MAG: hypothetical protein M1826_000274 [Phylliscum demangeonii]|nr:MAG: hypothetical protein M1826_000274 [Phylliscum demangeonii]